MGGCHGSGGSGGVGAGDGNDVCGGGGGCFCSGSSFVCMCVVIHSKSFATTGYRYGFCLFKKAHQNLKSHKKTNKKAKEPVCTLGERIQSINNPHCCPHVSDLIRRPCSCIVVNLL